jgi:hypothetical protein
MGPVDLLIALLLIIHIKGKRLSTGVTLDFIQSKFGFDIPDTDYPPVSRMIKKVFNQGSGGKTCPQDKNVLHEVGFDH